MERDQLKNLMSDLCENEDPPTVGLTEEVQADCMCIVHLCVPVCVIEGGGGASLTLVD